MPPLLVIDAHVHIYDCFALPSFLDAAYSNQLAAARKIGYDRSFISILMLAEGRRHHAFRRLSMEREKGNDLVFGEGPGDHKVFATGEVESLRIENAAGASVFLISGRQIVTSEGLEILALAAASEIPDGLPLEKAVAASENAGAVVVIPWSFGKWLGKRGRILREFLASRRGGGLFLGDNGGRPSFLRFPVMHGPSGHPFKVLPGSDPLPSRSQAGKAGSFGFTLRENLDTLRPAADLKRILSDPGVAPAPYGSPENPLRFALNQAVLRLWNRRT